MKNKLLLLITLSILILSQYSCKNKDDDNIVAIDNRDINDWIYQNMSAYYYWNDKLPARPDYNQSPDKFFENLLYPYNSTTHDGDRFSWIQPSYVDLLNTLNGVVSTDVGFEYYTGNRPGTNNTSLGYSVVYVKKNTDAATKLKRGDFITAVNGTAITMDNYTALLRQGKTSYKLTVTGRDTGLSSEITVNVVTNYAENPIYESKVFPPNNGHTVGYLAYNFFAADKGDGTYNYDFAVADLLNQFQTQGVTDLVLDLRYNSGGSVQSAVYLASALVDRNTFSNDIFARNDFNSLYRDWLLSKYGSNILYYRLSDKVQAFDKDNKITKEVAAPTLGSQLKSIYILTGRYTASASELIINGLRPYVSNLYIIGNTTYGKNVGSITLYEENNDKNKWGMQPIVLKISNKDNFSDFGGGFTPGDLVKGTSVNEFNYTLLPLGDEDETLLSEAISQITGTAKRMTRSAGLSPTILGSSFDNKNGAYQMFIDNNRFSIKK